MRTSTGSRLAGKSTVRFRGWQPFPGQSNRCKCHYHAALISRHSEDQLLKQLDMHDGQCNRSDERQVSQEKF